MDKAQVSEAAWRKSSYSGEGGNECVEVAPFGDGAAVRDSKNPRGGFVVLSDVAWIAFLATVAR
ncbi:DUF397 domain-containing protein [Amycolatopsis sp. RTGN1]|uniref:DUF397 domain-containing protein n=1 Tax=Amycolatopsis ponsaeliensis TaxID=2992142 RepID=UPI00254F8596|nr:DUF397 domain-containing protein [Amycolatopsis sp. RTGN1]